MAKEDQTISSLIITEGTKRVYQMEDGSIQTREGCSVSWRNNNPGNLKFEYSNSADRSVHTRRTKDEALSAAQSKYEGIVALDQWGNAVFATEEAGRVAQAKLLTRGHGAHTVEQMLPSYAVNDYSGKANIKAYAQGIYSVADAQEMDLRNKKIGDMSAKEMSALQEGMKKVEGYKACDVKVSPPSFRQLEEKSLQKMREEGLAPGASIVDPTHPGNGFYKQALAGLEKINAERGIPSDQRTCNAAGTLAASACESRFRQIDHVVLNDNGSKLLAVQGQPGAPLSKVIGVDTVLALNTPLAESSQAFAVAAAHNQQQNEQPLQVNRPVQAQTGPALAWPGLAWPELS